MLGRILPTHLHYSSLTDRRQYNWPITDEILIPGDGTKVSEMRDIVFHLQGNSELMQINECHPACFPLHYVLLFLHGELGWEPEIKLCDVQRDWPSTDRLTQMDFYSYRL